MNLGSDYHFPREKWKALTARIEEILHHQQSGLLPVEDADVEQEAKRLADTDKIVLNNREYAPEPVPEGDFHHVDVDTLESSRLRSVGVESMAWNALQSLELDKKLSALGLNGTELAAAIGTIIGRMAAPGSERATHTWLQQQSALGELIDYDYDKCSLSRLYRVSGLLLTHKDALESHLFERERTRFNLECTITLYDLTNTFFEGTAHENPLAARVRSKEKCSDCPLVTLGLVLDSSGFPRSSRVFVGNASEPATLKEMVKTLAGSADNPLIFMDTGIATEKNLTWLKEQRCRYLVVNRKRHQEWDEELSQLVHHDSNNEVRIYSKPSDDKEELECQTASKIDPPSTSKNDPSSNTGQIRPDFLVASSRYRSR